MNFLDEILNRAKGGTRKSVTTILEEKSPAYRHRFDKPVPTFDFNIPPVQAQQTPPGEEALMKEWTSLPDEEKAIFSHSYEKWKAFNAQKASNEAAGIPSQSNW